MKYEVTFTIAPSQGGGERKIVEDVTDTGDEKTNQADAILGATLTLDNEKIDRWTLKSCNKVTS
jgi:hypothetical protein